MLCGRQRRWLLAVISALLVSRAAASQLVPASDQPAIWDLRRPPLARLEIVSPGHREVQRTLVGLYVDERVCYLESIEVGRTTLRFAAGTAAPLREQESWAASAAEVIRQFPETQPIWVVGHAEPFEAPTPALAFALSGRRADAARALLVAQGLNAQRLRVLARGSAESALLRGELQQAAQWRRVSVQTEDKPSPHGARLIHVRGDQRPLLLWMLAVQQAAAQQPGTEPFEVGHHVPHFSFQFEKGALQSLGRLPSSEEGGTADLRALYRLVGEMTRSDCQIPQTVIPKRE